MNCFSITDFPEFKMGEPIDTSRFPSLLLPYDDNDEPFKSILKYSKGYIWLGFDGQISTLLFTLENESNKLNSITAMWTVPEKPKAFFEGLKTRFLPCIPIDKLLANPNVVIKDNSSEYQGSYEYSISSDGLIGLHYWVNVNY